MICNDNYGKCSNTKICLIIALQIAIARRLKNKDMEGKILLGKGFALMQQVPETGVEHYTKMNITNLKVGVACLTQARDIALKAGRYVNSEPCVIVRYVRSYSCGLVASINLLFFGLSSPKILTSIYLFTD